MSEPRDDLPEHWRFPEWWAQPYPFKENLRELRDLVRDIKALERLLVDVGQALAKFERQWPTDGPNLRLNGSQRLYQLGQRARELGLAGRLRGLEGDAPEGQ
jgi:hypothetical protein